MTRHNGSYLVRVPAVTGWDRAEWETLKYAASLTFRERLLWLEQASRLAVQLQNAKRKPLKL